MNAYGTTALSGSARGLPRIGSVSGSDLVGAAVRSALSLIPRSIFWLITKLSASVGSTMSGAHGPLVRISLTHEQARRLVRLSSKHERPGGVARRSPSETRSRRTSDRPRSKGLRRNRTRARGGTRHLGRTASGVSRRCAPPERRSWCRRIQSARWCRRATSGESYDDSLLNGKSGWFVRTPGTVRARG